MTADFRKSNKNNAALEQILRDSGDDDSNDGGFDETLLQPTQKTPDRTPQKSPTPNAKEQLSFLLREQKVLQEANRLTGDYYKRNKDGNGNNNSDAAADGGNDRAAARGRTKSPIGGVAGLNQTLSKFKSIDLNLIQALGNKGKSPANQRSVSANVLPANDHDTTNTVVVVNATNHARNDSNQPAKSFNNTGNFNVTDVKNQ